MKGSFRLRIFLPVLLVFCPMLGCGGGSDPLHGVDLAWVGQDAGILQCAPSDEKTLAAAEDELTEAGVEVRETSRGRVEGAAYCEACTCSAGVFNFLRIPLHQVGAAADLGYEFFERDEIELE